MHLVISKKNFLYTLILFLTLSGCSTTSYVIKELSLYEKSLVSIGSIEIKFSELALESDTFRRELASTLRSSLNKFSGLENDHTLVVNVRQLDFADGGTSAMIGVLGGANKVKADVYLVNNNEEQIAFYQIEGSYNFGGYTAFFDNQGQIVKRLAEEIILLLN